MLESEGHTSLCIIVEFKDNIILSVTQQIELFQHAESACNIYSIILIKFHNDSL